ncbi:MAG: argininosuccinate lyase [Anaerolineae bacterium]|jgi:argininosuccinate lyase|nr:argininosuccinate lyase [Anaerolineae bacterium]MBT4460048.1 argininosuccinate lyase [Anaerolineae bacterium]MBT6061520.1 argininosuccinate lyase [Anaerolineae bacterium]MBT6324080.1 argininosuccinate lyase [Anaerolineae bacterium]MBT7776450.1 argininosuccinate lyase [Anaerolineae bacterium]
MTNQPLWHGRFANKTNEQAFALNASISFDIRMADQDVRGSIAWAEAIYKAGILDSAEHAQIQTGLLQIKEEFLSQTFTVKSDDEDIHSAVERRLGEIIGALSGKLHTGRSRNDQVATDFRLWILDHIPALDSALADLQSALVERAEKDYDTIMPGYTHLQRAQPITLGQWFLSHYPPLKRDQARLQELSRRVGILPLGSGALAGCPYPIDRIALSESLGFDVPSFNSLDAVSNRDFAAEFLFVAALIGTHLSKLAEQVVLFTSAEFGFFELDDAYSTGSSLMPQKKNADPFELTRGKAGTLLGYLMGLMATLKGLPSTYDKDLQEDKIPIFAAFDTLVAMLPVIAGALRTLTVKPARMEASIDASMMATDLADYLVERGVPFREAHAISGEVVRAGITKEKSLDALTLAEYKEINAVFDEKVYEVYDARASIAKRAAIGGTAPDAVKAQIERAKEELKN